MKMRTMIRGAAAGTCLFGLVGPQVVSAVTDEDFKTLADLVAKQGKMLEALQQTHEQDVQKIQTLQTQLGQTQQTTTSLAARVENNNQPSYNAKAATHDFFVTGDAEVQFGQSAGQHATFAMADFAPIFLFRANENVLFEAGFDVTLQNNVHADGTRAAGSSTSVNLSFAQLDYLANDYVTLVAGDMLLPLGTYSERTAGWLNKIPDDPLVRDWLPGSGVGAQLRGAYAIGENGQSLTYAVYGANGPSSASGGANAADLDLSANVGDTPNWHANPSGGGRIGWFIPWKAHYDLELGISGQSGEWSDSGNHLWSGCVLDASLHLSQFFEIKGEYINTWAQTDDLGTIAPHGLWVQAAYKLAGLDKDLPIINDLELVGRYDNVNDDQGTKTDRYTVGYVYFITNTLLFEGDVEFLHSTGPNALPDHLYVFQLSYGF